MRCGRVISEGSLQVMPAEYTLLLFCFVLALSWLMLVGPEIPGLVSYE